MTLNSTNGTFFVNLAVPKTNLYIAISLYSIICITSVIGNSLVFIAFCKSSKLRNSRTNYLIVSLSCADLVAGCVAIPLYAYFMTINFKGYNSSPVYFVYQFADLFSITASVWHLAFISLERYFAIVWPVVHHIATSTSYFIAMTILWTLSLLSGGLSLRFYEYRIKYLIYNSSTLFGLPLIIIVYCYMSILRTTFLRSSSSRRTMERELKVSFTVFILIALFIICWCPFFLIGIISASGGHGVTITHVVFLKALHFATSCVNPIVYAARIPDFRNAFVKILPKKIVRIFCLTQKIPRESPPNSRQRTTSTLSASTVQTVDGTKTKATLLWNKGAVEKIPSNPVPKDFAMMGSVTPNKYVSSLSDSPSSTTGTQLTKV